MNNENEQFTTWLGQLPHFAKKTLANSDMGALYIEFKQQQRERHASQAPTQIKMELGYECDYVTELERRSAWAKRMLKNEQTPNRINFLKHDILTSGEGLESLWRGEHQEQIIRVFEVPG